PVRGARAALPGARDHARVRRPGARPPAVSARAAARAARDPSRPPDRHHPRRQAALELRARRLALPQPAFTTSVMPIPGADARPRRGDWATTRADPGASSLGDTVISRSSGFSLAFAWSRVSPTTLGTTPCCAFERTSVTRST